jgi:hypothetical protein
MAILRIARGKGYFELGRRLQESSTPVSANIFNSRRLFSKRGL